MEKYYVKVVWGWYLAIDFLGSALAMAIASLQSDLSCPGCSCFDAGLLTLGDRFAQVSGADVGLGWRSFGREPS